MTTYTNSDRSVALVETDALTLLRRLPNGAVQLVCTDPPWNTGYKQVLGENSYDDSFGNFKAFLYPILEEFHRVCRGITIVHMGIDEAAYVKVWMDEIWGRRLFQAELIMSSELGRGSRASGWPQKHSHIFVYGPPGLFNPEHLPTTFRKAVKPGYEDEKPVTSVLTVNLSTSDPQRVGYPSQKALSLYSALIKCYSKTGELVLDPFVGSGTTADAAHRTGRRVICGDKNHQSVAITRSRLKLHLEV